LKVPGIEEKLAQDVVAAVEKIRSSEEVIRKPGTSETLDWASALQVLGENRLTPKVAKQTLSCILKNSDEISLFDEERLRSILSESRK